MDPHSCCDRTRRSRIRRRQHALIGTAVLVALVACGDPYLHTNPYDPVFPVQFTIAGPDTLFSLGDVAQYSVQTNPAWPDTGFVWTLDTFTNYFIVPGACFNQVELGDTVLRPVRAGLYQSIKPPLEPYTFTVPIAVWTGTIDSVTQVANCGGPGSRIVFVNEPRHIGYKSVVVTQRVTHIQLRCPATHGCAPLAVGDSAFIWVDGFDAGGSPIVGLASPTVNPATGNPLIPYPSRDTAILRAQRTNNPVATYLSRDSTVARATPIGIRVARVIAVKSGSTWVVATRGALQDSLQIVVP